MFVDSKYVVLSQFNKIKSQTLWSIKHDIFNIWNGGSKYKVIAEPCSQIEVVISRCGVNVGYSDLTSSMRPTINCDLQGQTVKGHCQNVLAAKASKFRGNIHRW